MITLELAQKLKDAGLKWGDKAVGDRYYCDGMRWIFHGTEYDDNGIFKYINKSVWLPSLSQLLAEIRAREYWWYMKQDTRLCQITVKAGIKAITKESNIPEEAAGLGLFWILEQKPPVYAKSFEHFLMLKGNN